MPGTSAGGMWVQFALDALRSARCARGVLQQIAFDLVVDRRIRLVCNAFRVAVPTVEIVVGDDQQRRKPVRQLGIQTLEESRSAAEPMMALALLLSMM